MKNKSLKERLQEAVMYELTNEKAIVNIIGELFEKREQITADDIISAINGYFDSNHNYYDDWHIKKFGEPDYAYDIGFKVAVIEKLSEKIKEKEAKNNGMD